MLFIFLLSVCVCVCVFCGLFLCACGLFYNSVPQLGLKASRSEGFEFTVVGRSSNTAVLAVPVGVVVVVVVV